MNASTGIRTSTGHGRLTNLLMSRAFTFSANYQIQAQYGGNINQIQPHSAKIQFMESDDPVDITIWADRTIPLVKKNSPTNNYLLQPDHSGFPIRFGQSGLLQFADVVVRFWDL